MRILFNRSSRGAWLLLAWPTCAVAPASIAQPTFVVGNEAAGILHLHTMNGNTRYSRLFGAGAAAADYDRDGRIDLFLAQAYGFPDALYRNNGDGTFTNVAAAAGVAGLKESRAAIWLDYDNDEWLDLFIACDPDAIPGQPLADPNTTANLLYHNNGDGTFVEVSQSAGVRRMPNPELDQTTGGLAAADINNDGFLDVYVSCWNNPNALYLNNGDGTFSEIGVAAGVSEPGASWAPMFHDVNDDGWADLLLNVDFAPNRLLINQQDNTFVDAAAAYGFANAFNEMGMALGDYDNDGDLDLCATNIEVPFGNPNQLDKYTLLLRNEGPAPAAYADVSVAAGIARTGWGWGCTWLDCDNDGWLDLAVTNGFPGAPYGVDPARLFHNLGDGTFAEISAAAGYTSIVNGRGLIAFDPDEDGDLDLLETNYSDFVRYYRNQTATVGHWLAIDAIAAGASNRYAVGAVITVSAGGRSQAQQISAGTSFVSAEPPRKSFGLGANISADVAVRWPNGTTESYAGVAADQIVRIREGVGVIELGDADADGDVDASDAAKLWSCMTGPSGGLAPGSDGTDLDRDIDVDIHDYAAAQSRIGQ